MTIVLNIALGLLFAAALPILVVFSLTGFVGSVAIARFMGRRKDDPQ